MHDHMNFKLQMAQSCKLRKDNFTHMICGAVAATVGLFNDMRQYQYCILYRYRLVTVFIICMCPPVNIHRHGLYYVLRV